MRPARPQSPSDAVGTRIIACAVIAVGAFFSVYDAIAHRDVPYAPTLGKPYHPQFEASETSRQPLWVDMSSPSVAFANEDVVVSKPPTAAKQLSR
jgi:hypothetical protein